MAKEGKFDGGHLTQNPPQTTLQCLISFDAHNVYKVLLCSFDRNMARLKSKEIKPFADNVSTTGKRSFGWATDDKQLNGLFNPKQDSEWCTIRADAVCGVIVW